MGLMGAIRELARKNYHVYRVFKDMTPDAYPDPSTHRHDGHLGYLDILRCPVLYHMDAA